MADIKPYGIVYEALCVPTGKRYIGITTKGIKHRWMKHCLEPASPDGDGLHSAIRAHGAGAFIVRPVMSALSKSDLYACEVMMISQEGTMKPSGYNAMPGDVVHLDRDAGEARLRQLRLDNERMEMMLRENIYARKRCA